MMGREKVVEMLLNAGANPASLTTEGLTASQVATNYHYLKLAAKIKNSCKKKVKVEKQIEKKVDIMENVSIFKPNNIIVPQNGTPNQTSLNQNKLNDDCGEEVSWAMQMKKDLEEQKKKDELDKKRK